MLSSSKYARIQQQQQKSMAHCIVRRFCETLHNFGMEIDSDNLFYFCSLFPFGLFAHSVGAGVINFVFPLPTIVNRNYKWPRK